MTVTCQSHSGILVSLNEWALSDNKELADRILHCITLPSTYLYIDDNNSSRIACTLYSYYPT